MLLLYYTIKHSEHQMISIWKARKNIRNAIFRQKKETVFSGLAKAPLWLARMLFMLTVLLRSLSPNAHQESSALFP